MQSRIQLIGYRGTNPNDQKHASDPTTAIVRKWAETVDSLKAARSATMQTLEATEGKGGAVVLKIADKPRFDALRQAISSYQERITSFEEAIRKLDEIISVNGLGAGFLQDLKHRINSASSGIYQQKSNISKLTAFYTTQNPRMPPEEVLKLPEFVQKRAECERLIKLDEEYLAKFKPICDEMEGIISSV